MNLKALIPATALSLSGCVTAPSYEEIQRLPINRTELVHAPLDCLFEKGVQTVTSRVWMSEPKPDGYLNQKQGYGWFRQPLTILMLKAEGANTTRITRQQTTSAAGFGQGEYLMQYFASNPCIQKP
ncbi:hypothetical protein [Achromobacter animicus]|uniref:hypothetical protein n=1 Tax=Achromobacter animicus TaxID=1389935 RepID=UPI0028A63B3C|nr:hypothetical protein [Achromobacter animicus]